MDRFLLLSEGINRWIGRVIAWAALLMVLITLVVVILRYVFDIGWIAMQESVTYLHAALFMLGAAYTLQNDGHVRVDIFYRRFSPRRQALVELFGSLVLLLPMCAFVLWSSLGYVSESIRLWEGSRESGGLPLVWLLKSLIPTMALLLLLQGLLGALRAVHVLAGGEPASPRDGPADGCGREV